MILNDRNTKEIWPSTGDDGSSFYYKYNETVDQKMFHVDYLRETFRDFARPNLYKIEFYLPKDDEYNFISEYNQELTEMAAKTVNIPGYDIGRQEIKRMGQRIFIPTGQNYGELQMTLFCDDNYTQRKFLHSWLKRLIYDTDNNVYHKMKLASNASLIIRQFDNKFNTIFAAEFGFVWPSSVGEIQLSQDSDSQIVEFPASFSYSTYKILSMDKD